MHSFLCTKSLKYEVHFALRALMGKAMVQVSSGHMWLVTIVLEKAGAGPYNFQGGKNSRDLENILLF